MELSKLSNAVKAILAIAALIPGVALLAGLVDIPPDLHELLVICGSILAPAMVMISLLLRAYVVRLHPLAVVAAVAASLVGGFLIAFNYLQFADEHIEPISYEGYAYPVAKGKEGGWYLIKPSRQSQELQDLVAGHDSLADAIHDPIDGKAVIDAVRRDSRPDQWRMFWQVLSAEALLLFGFLIGAWRVAATLRQVPRQPG